MRTRNLDELSVFARNFLADLQPKSAQAFVIGLSGELASGKTAFVKALAKHLGVKQEVISPTFVIFKRYPLNKQQFKNLIHIDCYRLAGAAELEKLDWQTLIADPANLIIIEWAERVESLLPSDCRRLLFKYLNETSREISVLR